MSAACIASRVISRPASTTRSRGQDSQPACGACAATSEASAPETPIYAVYRKIASSNLDTSSTTPTLWSLRRVFLLWAVALAIGIDPTSVGSSVWTTRGAWFAGTRQPEERVVRRRRELPQKRDERGPVQHCCPQQFPLERSATAAKQMQRRVRRRTDRRDRNMRRAFWRQAQCRDFRFHREAFSDATSRSQAGNLPSNHFVDSNDSGPACL